MVILNSVPACCVVVLLSVATAYAAAPPARGSATGGPAPQRATDPLRVTPGAPARLALRPVKKGEERIFGSLERIECVPGRRIVFQVKSDNRVVRLSAARLQSVEFISYRKGLDGSVECGARRPPDPVYVTSRPAPAATSRASKPEGEVVAVEFLPKDYK